jgi:phenylalanyl-tRNA synthetase alpha chain
MTNEAIPNLSAFDDNALDRAFVALKQQATEEAAAVTGPDGLEAFKLRWLGRKQGILTEVSSRWLKGAPPEAKKAVGERFKTLKELIEQLREAAEGAGPNDAALACEAIDITLPGTRRLTGAEHPITRTLNAGHAGDREPRAPSAARSAPAAYAYVARPNAHHGTAAAACSNCDSRKGSQE